MGLFNSKSKDAAKNKGKVTPLTLGDTPAMRRALEDSVCTVGRL